MKQGSKEREGAKGKERIRRIKRKDIMEKRRRTKENRVNEENWTKEK